VARQIKHKQKLHAAHDATSRAYLQVFPELCEAVGLSELQLVTSTASKSSSKACEALLAAAAHSHKQCIAPRLAQHPSYAGDVVHSILEEDQAHGLAAAAIVVFEKALQCLYQLGLVHNLKSRGNGKVSLQIKPSPTAWQHTKRAGDS